MGSGTLARIPVSPRPAWYITTRRKMEAVGWRQNFQLVVMRRRVFPRRVRTSPPNGDRPLGLHGRDLRSDPFINPYKTKLRLQICMGNGSKHGCRTSPKRQNFQLIVMRRRAFPRRVRTSPPNGDRPLGLHGRDLRSDPSLSAARRLTASIGAVPLSYSDLTNNFPMAAVFWTDPSDSIAFLQLLEMPLDSI